MIRINLLPVREIKAEITRRQELTIAFVFLGLALVVMAGFHITKSSRLSGLKGELAELKNQIESLNTRVKEVAGLRKNIAIIKEKRKAVNELSKKKTGPVRVMESLSSATPTRLWLKEFKESAGKVSLNGLAVDNETIAEFLKALSSSPYFDNVELVETTQVNQKGATLKKFVMRSNLFYHKSPAAQPNKGGPRPGTKEQTKR